MVGRCWDGKYMLQNSISASSLEVTGMFILQAGFSTEFFISMNGHNILLATPAQSCSAIFDFFLLPCLLPPDPISYQILTHLSQVFPVFLLFHSPITTLNLMTYHLELRNFLTCVIAFNFSPILYPATR